MRLSTPTERIEQIFSPEPSDRPAKELEAMIIASCNDDIWRSEGTKNPWKMPPMLKKEIEAAPDHAAAWVELEI